MMTSLRYKIWAAVCAALLTVGGVRPSWAQDATPTGPAPDVTATPLPQLNVATATPVPGDPGAALLFSDFGFAETTLIGPFAVESYQFDLPSTWALTEGAALELDVSAFFNTGTVTPAGAPRTFGGSLTVILNDITLGGFALNTAGDRRIFVPLSPAALAAVAPDGSYDLTLFWDSGVDCLNLDQANLVVRSTSRFSLPHSVHPPALDLAQLPRPIFESSLWPEAATLIVPDQPSHAELQAALTVAAGLGNLTSGELLLDLLPASRMGEVQATHHLIFVGRPGGLPELALFELPLVLGDNVFAAPGDNPDDGVVALAPSPWNAAKVVLVVSGNSDAAVVKAAQAVSTGAVRPNGVPNLALVAAVDPGQAPTTVPINRTLTDLAYQRVTFDRLGSNATSFAFYVPAGQTTDGEAYVDLHFNHSALLNYDRAGLSVSLNGQPVGSLRLSDVSTHGDYTTRLLLPGGAIVPGVNRLSLEAALIPLDNCLDPRLSNVWLTIWPDSLLHLPLRAAATDAAPRFDLDDYHRPFSRDPGLADTTFVLAVQDPAGWATAARIAFDLGDASNGQLIQLAAYYAAEVPAGALQTSHLLLVGRPSQLALIQELSEALPAPFAAGSDIALEANLPVIYRQAPQTSVGYVELATSPWSAERAVLAVLGNTEEGVQWAGAAVSQLALRGQLAGNYAVVVGQRLFVADTRLIGGSDAAFDAANAAGTPVPVPLGSLTAPMVERPWWLLPALVATLILILLTAGVGLLISRREREQL